MKKVPTAKICRRRRNEASLCFSTTTALLTSRTGILLTMDPTLHYKMMGDTLWIKRAGTRMRETEVTTLVGNGSVG